jgi:hypothetical protein
MTVGIPGVGLGGIFYLLSAVLMPVHQLRRAVRGQGSTRWPLVIRQTAIAVGILGALWLTGWALGFVLSTLTHSPFSTSRGGLAGPRVHNLLRTGALVLSLGTLGLVLLLVQVARLIVPRDRAARAIAAGRAAVVAPAAPAPEAKDPIGLRIDSGTLGRAH